MFYPKSLVSNGAPLTDVALESLYVVDSVIDKESERTLITEEALVSANDNVSALCSCSAKYKDSAIDIVSEIRFVVDLAKVSAKDKLSDKNRAKETKNTSVKATASSPTVP
jgi:hypothetical protein